MVKKIITILLIIVATAGLIFIIQSYLIKKENEDLIKRGNELIKKVDQYKAKNHKLPNYLEDKGFNLPNDSLFSYDLGRDSSTYTIGFQIGFFRSMVYYSDRKVWEAQH